MVLSVIISSCYVFSVHILNHYTDREYSQYKESYKLAFLDRHKTVLIVLGVIAMVSAVSLSSLLGIVPLLIVLVASVAGLVYSFEIVPEAVSRVVRIRRLRDIPASKNLLMAFAWSLIAVFVPVYEMHRRLDAGKWGQLGIVFLYTFTLVFARSTLLDIRISREISWLATRRSR